MIVFLLQPLLVLILIWGFFQPGIASWIFVLVIGLVEAWLFMTDQLREKLKIENTKWSVDEIKAIKEYYIYFNYPFAARTLSSTLSGIQLSALIWVPWLIWNRHWAPAVIIGANYFIAAPLAVKLNPRFFLHDTVESKGQMQYLPLMRAVDSVCDKILEEQKGRMRSSTTEKST